MEATPKVVEIFGLSFSVPILISCGVSVLLIALFTIFASRKVSMKPGKLQNALEALMDFTKGIVNSAVDEKTAQTYYLYIFSLFLPLCLTVSLFFLLDCHKYPCPDPTDILLLNFPVFLSIPLKLYIYLWYLKSC